MPKHVTFPASAPSCPVRPSWRQRGSSIARAMIQRRKVIIGTLSAAAAVATVGGSAPGSAIADPATAPGNSGVSGREEKASLAVVPVRLTVTPAMEATGVSPTSPIVVTVENGELRSVEVTAG